jgi:hypothetical protein
LATTPVRTGIDALYVAAAKVVGVSVVYSWDESVLKCEYQGVKVIEPPGSTNPKLDLSKPPESGSS